MEEYRVCRKEIEHHLTWQTQAVAMGTTLMVAFVAAMATLLSKNLWKDNYLWVLLTIPFYSSVFGMLMVNKDEMILDLASYQDEILKPRLGLLSGAEVLLWHKHKNDRRFNPERSISHKLSKILVSPFPHAFFIITGIGAFIILFYLKNLPGYSNFKTVHWTILAIDLFIFLYFLISVSLTSLQYRR